MEFRLYGMPNVRFRKISLLQTHVTISTAMPRHRSCQRHTDAPACLQCRRAASGVDLHEHKLSFRRNLLQETQQLHGQVDVHVRAEVRRVHVLACVADAAGPRQIQAVVQGAAPGGVVGTEGRRRFVQFFCSSFCRFRPGRARPARRGWFRASSR